MKELALGVVLGGTIAASFNNAFSTAGRQVRSLGTAMDSTKSTLSAVSRYQTIAGKLERDQQALELVDKRLGALQVKMQAGPLGRKDTREFQQLTTQYDVLSKKTSDYQKKLNEASATMRKAGVDTSNLASEQDRLGKTIQKQTELMNRRNKAMQDFSDRKRSIGFAVGAVTASTKAAIDLESAMADVRKVVDFDTPEAFDEMREGIEQLATEIPGLGAAGIAAIVAAGGQAGFANDELLEFAETAGKMGVAFDISADEAGQMMAQWRTAFKMPQAEVTKLADQINYLGNNSPANARKISEVVTQIGPLGKVGGLASGEIAALGATITGMGIESSVAGTGIKNVLLALNAGGSATAKQSKAFKRLGLDAKQMAVMMQDDAAGAITTVMESIGDLAPEEQTAVLKDLFGKESVASIAPMLSNLDLLKVNLGRVADQTKYAGSMEKEFQAYTDTTAADLQRTGESFARVGRIIGRAFMPPLRAVLWVARGVFNGLAALGNIFPPFTYAVIWGATAWMGYKTAMSGVSLLATYMPGLLVNLGSKVLFVSKAIRIAGLIAWNVGRLMMLNPIGLAVTAIAGAAFLIYKYWEPITGFFSRLWDKVGAIFKKAGRVLWPALGPIGWAIKAFGGFDGDNATQEATAAPSSASKLIAGVKAASPLAAGGQAVQQTNTSNYQIAVHAAPGMDEQALARQVNEQLDARERNKASRQRGQLFDQEF